MSVLITDDFSIFNTQSKNYRLVIFVKKTKYNSVNLKINELRNNNSIRVRKGTLRIIEDSFNNTDIYPPRFNNYVIELNVTENEGDLTNRVDTIISTLKTLNKSATINIHNWDKISSRQVRHTCGSKMNAVVHKHGVTTTNQNNVKTIKV
jgi:hypothetical protein